MIEQNISDFCNDSREKIMDFDDTELMSPNNILDFHSFMDSNNNVRENNNADIVESYEEKIERFTNEKILIQNHLSNKIIDLQTQILKLKNTLEKSEMSRAEIEVEVTKANRELRSSQRQQNLKVNEFENTKIELSNHFKTLETEYINQISHLNNLNKILQDQLNEEKHSNIESQRLLNDQISHLSLKYKEKEKELSKYKSVLLNREDSAKEQQSEICDLTEKVRELEKIYLVNSSKLIEKDEKLEKFQLSEQKLKEIILDLNVKINQLESQNFEEKHELNDTRNYQQNLQSQLLDLQQKQITHEKERQILLEKLSQSCRRIKELEEALKNQVRIAANYSDEIKKLENEKENQENSVNETNEELQMKVEELESKLQIQDRVIEEVNDEISSSRETESIAVSHLTRTLEELEKYIIESSGNHAFLKSPQRNKPHIRVSGPGLESPSKNRKADISGDILKQDIEYQSTSKNIMKNVKDTILNFQERINTLESDRLEAMSKLQSQDKEIKNLKSQLRRYVIQQKSLESDNNAKQQEIENLLEEISNVKCITNVLRQESGKNITNLKQTLHTVADQYQDNIETRDNYLQSISKVIKEALSNSFNNFVDKGNSTQNPQEFSQVLIKNHSFPKSNDLQNVIEISTQTPAVHNKDNLELTANLTGTFHFHNENNVDTGGIIDCINDKRTRCYQDNNNTDRKHVNQVKSPVEDKKKSSLKRVSKKTEGKTDTSGTYVDSCQSWPAIREVISTELITLLNKYDIQRAQYRTMPNDKFNVNCQQLMSELSAKESLITRLLSNQNSNSAQPHTQMDLISRGQQTNSNEPGTNRSPIKINTTNQNSILRNISDNKKKSKPLSKAKFENVSSNSSNKRGFKSENQVTLVNLPCCCGDNESIPNYTKIVEKQSRTSKQESNNNIHKPPSIVNWQSNEPYSDCKCSELGCEHFLSVEADYILTSEYAGSDFEVSRDC